jgi:hypothetical protein
MKNNHRIDCIIGALMVVGAVLTFWGIAVLVFI